MIDLNGTVFQCNGCDGLARKKLDKCQCQGCDGTFHEVAVKDVVTVTTRQVVVKETYQSLPLMDVGFGCARIQYDVISNDETEISVSDHEQIREWGCSNMRYSIVTNTVHELVQKLFGLFAFNNAEQEDKVLVMIANSDLDELQKAQPIQNMGIPNENNNP